MMPSRQQLDNNIEAVISKTILAEMISAAHAANMPKPFIDNIELKKISDTQYEIENAWKNDEGKPLAVFFEYGTEDHYIQPRTPGGVLAFPSGSPESGQKKAIYSKRADSKKGDTLFSKGHWVSGLPAYEPMTQGFRKGTQKMREVLRSNAR